MHPSRYHDEQLIVQQTSFGVVSSHEDICTHHVGFSHILKAGGSHG